MLYAGFLSNATASVAVYFTATMGWTADVVTRTCVSYAWGGAVAFFADAAWGVGPGSAYPDLGPAVGVGAVAGVAWANTSAVKVVVVDPAACVPLEASGLDRFGVFANFSESFDASVFVRPAYCDGARAGGPRDAARACAAAVW